MMVVIPTSSEVSMSFRASSVDRFAYLLTLAGLVCLFAFRRGDRRSNRASEEVSMSPSRELVDSAGETPSEPV
jgi:hypothetical protein